MLSLVTAAEHQYRLETRTREREQAVRAAIRARLAPETPAAVAPAARTRRAAWARPIGLHAHADCPAALA